MNKNCARSAPRPLKTTMRTTRLRPTALRQLRPSYRPPALRLTPQAWAKLVYLRDAGRTEIGGFGTSRADDPLLVDDVQLVRQRCSWAHVAFQDEAVADYFDRMVDAGRRPEEFARIWVHTHPGDSPAPSAADEETFARVFGGCDWSVMLIVARNDAAYARLQFSAGPGGAVRLPVAVDDGAPFGGSDHAAWQAEYEACVAAASTTVDSLEELLGGEALWSDAP
ncbi:MAG TPA: Mov34/MPN/PAD-1 family protein [Lacipirellulaceae bacterium]|nr:Mov34/MPN/PAD-1 family protein [Lacipirellulaceae bacterium]